MFYKIQRETAAGTLPPNKWQGQYAIDKEAAAVGYLRRLKPAATEFPIVIHVARPKPCHDNGVPMVTDALTFTLAD